MLGQNSDETDCIILLRGNENPISGIEILLIIGRTSGGSKEMSGQSETKNLVLM